MREPITFIIETSDIEKLPPQELAEYVEKHFRQGRYRMDVNGDQVYLSLNYCPNRDFMNEKFKDLPVRWLRTNVDDEEEFKLLCEVLREYKCIDFNIEDEEALALGENY